jgi:hypothetical protein
MHTSKLVWRIVAALTSLAAVTGCGDDSSPSDGGDGGGGASAGATTAETVTSSSSAGGEGGDGGQGSATTGEGGAGGGTGGAGGAEPSCGDGVVQGDEECDGDDLGDATCESLGRWFGVVACTDACTLDATGCAGPEICDDGGDDDLDGLADCADPACSGDAACDLEGEVECSDFEDDDLDGFTDCSDPDCQARPVCALGDGAPGTPCTANRDCAAAAGDDPACLSAALTGGTFVGGYCSEHCNLKAQDCGDGAACVPIAGGVCLAVCEDAGDCRAGYECTGDDTLSVCVPSPSSEEDCTNAADDDGDGLVDCDDVSCVDDAACADVELSCNDLVDDDADGLIDCADPESCQGSGLCEPGDRPLGAPCSHPSECASLTGAPACLLEGIFPNGACSSWCETDDDCGADGVCVAGPGSGVCLDRCEAMFDCFPGQFCDGTLGACVPVEGELCGNGRDDDADDLADCDDDECADTLACTAPESDCANLEDDDQDGQLDCGDPTSCGGDPACDPGDGDVGSTCDAATDCAATGSDPICLTEDATGFPGGHCSEWCDPAAQDCAPGAVCVYLGDPSEAGVMALCLVGCTDDVDCGDGYECREADPTGTLACLPMAVE